MKNKLTVFFLFFTILAAVLSGCQPEDGADTQASKTAQTLDTTMYCYCYVRNDGMTKYTSNAFAFLPAEISEDQPIDLRIPLSENSDFSHGTKGNNTTLVYEEEGFPYLCFKTHLYHPLTDSYFPFDVAIDFEKQYMIFLIPSNAVDSITVAAADPNVEPETIYTHFAAFLEFCGCSNFVFDETEPNQGSSTNAQLGEVLEEYESSMVFSVITPDGALLTQFYGTVNAVRYENPNRTGQSDFSSYLCMTLDYNAETFPYVSGNLEVAQPCFDYNEYCTSLYTFYNPDDGCFDYTPFALDTEGGRLVFCILSDHQPEYLLVASDDCNTAPAELMAFFESFIASNWSAHSS